jgi:hypothetical protein
MQPFFFRKQVSLAHDEDVLTDESLTTMPQTGSTTCSAAAGESVQPFDRSSSVHQHRGWKDNFGQA